MKKLIILLTQLCFVCSLGISQNMDPISEKKLKKDFKQLLKLIDAHPKPYRHISKEEFKDLSDKIESEIQGEMTSREFYELVAPLITTIKDGHTSIRLPYLWMKRYGSTRGVFPYKVHLTDENELYVLSHYSNEGVIPKGSRVEKINDLSIAAFLEKIDPYLSYERLPFRNAIIEENINQYIYLAFGDAKITLTYVSDEVHTQEIEFIDYKLWEKSIKKNREEREERMAKGRPYQFKKITDDIGLLSIYSFSVGDFSKYEFFLKSTFNEIKKENISSLIIDVRGNYGGYPKVSAELFHYLSNKYFKTMGKSETKISQAYRDYFVKRYNGINSRKYHFLNSTYGIDLESVLHGKIGDFALESAIYNEPPKTNSNEFRGDIYLLTDRRSYSASSSFAATFRCYGFGKIIGAETGGTSIFHANAMHEKLKHSKLSLSIATTRDYTACYNIEDQGIVPDIPYKPSVLDLVSGQDTHLNYLIFLLRKYKKKAAEQKETAGF